MNTIATVPEAAQPRSWSPLVVGAMTLALTLYLSFQSSELHTVERALREHETLLAEQPQYKLYQAWKKVRYERVLGNAGPPLDEYQKLVDAARDLVDKRGAIQAELQSASQLHIVPPVLRGSWAPIGTLFSEAHAASAEDRDQAGAPLPLPADNGCNDAVPAPRPTAPKPQPTVLQDLSVHQRDFGCFLLALRIDPVDFSYPMWGTVFDAREKVNLLVSWLLPGVYGLMGACFYLMRAMLQTGAARLAGSGRAVAAVDILLRMAAGGLAGIIVGWFWVPAAAAAPISSVPSLSFGIAFLAGFSTDALFSLLDKLLKGLSPADEAKAATT